MMARLIRLHANDMDRGFNLALSSRHNVGYGIVIAIVFIILAGAYFLLNRRRRRQKVYETPAARNFQSGLPPQQYGGDFALQEREAPPPGYSRPVNP